MFEGVVRFCLICVLVTFTPPLSVSCGVSLECVRGALFGFWFFVVLGAFVVVVYSLNIMVACVILLINTLVVYLRFVCCWSIVAGFVLLVIRFGLSCVLCSIPC